MSGTVRLDVDGTIATITNDNPDKHNAFDDDMDAQLFDILGELKQRADVRVVIWRGEGKSFSSGRDVGSIGTLQVPLSHHELMRRGHRGIQHLWDLDAPVHRRVQGLGDGRVVPARAAVRHPGRRRGTRFRLPETTYGVIPDTGGVAVLHEMCGPGLVSDMVLTGRILSAEEALVHGIVQPARRRRRPRRDGARDGGPDRRGARGDGEDGARSHQAPRAAADPRRRWPTR